MLLPHGLLGFIFCFGPFLGHASVETVTFLGGVQVGHERLAVLYSPLLLLLLLSRLSRVQLCATP